MNSVKIRNTCLQGAQMQRIDAKSLHIGNCFMENINMDNASFAAKRNHMEHCHMAGMSMKKANGKVIFKYCDMPGAVLTASRLDSSVFSGCTMINVDMTECTLQKAKFNNTSMTNTDFTGTNMNSAEFIDVDVKNAKFINVDVENADLSGIKNWESATWENIRNWKSAKLPEGLRKRLEAQEARALPLA